MTKDDPAVPSTPSLESSAQPLEEAKTVWGLKWASVAFVSDKLSTLVTMAVLARILDPAEFGLIATALLVATIVDAFREIGLRDALIWHPGAVGAVADTAFCLNAGLGALLMLAFLGLAPHLTSVLGEPRLLSLFQILAVGFLVSGLGATHEALQDKALLFKRRYAVDLIATFVKAGVTIPLALANFGVVSVALGILAAATVRSVGRWVTYAWIPRLRPSVSKAGELVAYARHVLTTGLADAVVERADQIVVVALLGNVQIGYYYVAARIPEILIGSINVVAAKVLFPSYVALASDRTALREFFLTTTRFSAYVALPLGVGVALVSDLVIEVVFGSQWDRAAPVLAILSLCGVGYAVLWSAGDVIKAVGRPEYLARLSLLQMVLIFPIMLASVSIFGAMEAAAFGLLISLAIDNSIVFIVVRRLITFTPAEFLRIFHGTAIATGTMVLAVLVVRTILVGTSTPIQLGVSVCAGSLFYCGVLWLADKDHLKPALRMISGRFRKAI